MTPIRNLKKIMESIQSSKVSMPDFDKLLETRSLNPVVSGINTEDFENIESDILKELQTQNDLYREANRKLITTITEQHETNRTLQRSTSRLTILALILAAGPIILGVFALHQQKQNSENFQHAQTNKQSAHNYTSQPYLLPTA